MSHKLVQVVANSTSEIFLLVVGSELIQKYLGDGPKLVREMFRVANEISPSIVFIDEIDAVGTKRYLPVLPPSQLTKFSVFTTYYLLPWVDYLKI